MTIPTPRAALKQLLARLDQTTDKDGPVPAWMDSYCTAVQALKAEPVGEGPSLADVDELCAEFGFHLDDDQGDGLEILRDMIAAALSRWSTPVGEPSPQSLPLNYIDPEHAGQDRELLEAFYRACAAEGGTTDEIHLRGIKAVLAARPTIPPVPEPGEVEGVIDDLHRVANTPSDEDLVCSAHTCRRAATLLQQQEAELAALRRVPVVVEALTRLYWWGGMSGAYAYSADVVLGVRDWINSGMVGGLPPLPAWIADRCPPLPAPQAGEGEA